MDGLRQFPAIAVCFTRDEILDIGELAVTEAELSELLSFVQIYRALGGGWQP